MQLDLYWIPLGAGTHVVARQRPDLRGHHRVLRPATALRHLPCRAVATTDDGTIAVEMAPVPDGNGRDERGVVAEGPVGLRWLGAWRIFRYEIRCWERGVIPDLADAVASPIRLSDDPNVIARVLHTLPSVPTPVWGRDELDAGEMWNSNSVVSWTLSSAGLDVDRVALPPGGRAPGWDAGRCVAGRSECRRR